MAKNNPHIRLIPLIAGLLFIAFLILLVRVGIPQEYLIYLNILIVLLIVGILIVVYFCVKNVSFREKTFSVMNLILGSISKLGEHVIEDLQSEEKGGKGKEKRIPISHKKKNEVYDIAGGKCQFCGKTSNLKIHHIDGNPSNNNIANLILLCGNHHDDADKNNIPRWRLKKLRTKQATPDHTSYHG